VKKRTKRNSLSANKTQNKQRGLRAFGCKQAKEIDATNQAEIDF